MSLGRQVVIVLILLAAASAGYWYASSRADGNDTGATTRPKRPLAAVEIAAAQQTTLVQEVEAVGTTLARQAVDIKPAASGQVVEIDFSPGSFMEAGARLIRLDDTVERADVAETRADLRKAELELERAIKLAAKKTIAQATVDELEAAQQAAEARLLRASKALKDREVTTPFSGRVGLKQVAVGTRVNDETVITTLDDLTEIQIEFNAPEIFFNQVKTEQPIKATSAAFNDRVFEGVIESVDSRIDRASRSFRVRAKIPNPDLVLPSGMFMLVNLTLQERNALTVPEEAVVVANDEAYVFVVSDNIAERRLVTLGQRSFGKVEVTGGLDEGTSVVTIGLQRVRDGAGVRISNGGKSPSGGDQRETPKKTTEPSA